MKKMHMMSGLAGSLLTIVTLSGCVGTGVNAGLEVGTTTVNHFGGGPTAKQAESTQPLPALSAGRQIILLQDQPDLLRLILTPEGISADEKTLGSSIAQLVTGAVSANDAKVISGGAADVRLTVRSNLITVDKAGEYYRLNCDIALELKAVNSSRIFGSKTIKLVGVRKLGKDAALAQFDEPASKAAAEWCREELKRVADQELGVAVLTMQLPAAAKGKPRSQALDAQRIKAIGDNLAKLPNLVSYEFVGQDQEKGDCQYRVVYFKTAYPSGISNEVSALIRSIVNHK